MKKVLLTAALAIASIFTTHAQLNLEFDNTFNGGNPSLDGYNTIAPDYDYSNYGGMKKLNDSIFVYFANAVNWTNQNAFSEAFAIVSHSDGTVERLVFHSVSYSYSGSPEDYYITDIIANTSNEQVFVVKNGIYLDGATNRRCVLVYGYQFDGIGSSFPAITNWGDGASGVTQISAPGVELFDAKGSLIGNYPCLAYTYGYSPRNIAFSTLGNMGAFTGLAVVTSNPANRFSQVADVIAISTTEVYIADNSATAQGTNPTTYDDYPRILKWKAANTMLDNTYGGGDGIADISWNSQVQTAFIQDEIKSMYYDGGKLFAVGISREDIGSPYTPTHGRVTRFNSDGTLDNTFGTNGTFAPDFSSDRFRTYFNDLDKSADGSIYIGGGGSASTSPNDPSECFILAVNDAGAIQTGKGNNGFLFETNAYSEIIETVIVPGASVLTDKFVFNGIKVLNPDPQQYEIETAVGRLVWNNGTTGLEEATQNELLNCYPVPTSTVLTIETKENTTVTLVNLSGATLAEYELFEGVNRIDVNHLTQGVYFIHSDKGGVVKWIKE